MTALNNSWASLMHVAHMAMKLETTGFPNSITQTWADIKVKCNNIWHKRRKLLVMNTAQALLGYTLSDLKHVYRSILFHPKIKSTTLDNDSEVKNHPQCKQLGNFKGWMHINIVMQLATNISALNFQPSELQLHKHCFLTTCLIPDLLLWQLRHSKLTETEKADWLVGNA